MNTYGLKLFKKQRKGLIIGESRDRQCWWIRWNGNGKNTSYCYAKDFIVLRNTTRKQVPTNPTT